MPRRKKAVEEEAELDHDHRHARNLWPLLRFCALTTSTVVVVFGVAWAAWQADQVLHTDARFRLPAEEPGTDLGLTVTGLHQASHAAVLRVFAEDREASVASVDLEERRRRLRLIEWVKDATVRRIWPNRLAVEIVERKPVAFLPVPATAAAEGENARSYRHLLLDEEGVVLRPATPIEANLPVLLGVRDRDTLDARQRRVRQMLMLLAELGDRAGNVLEVDVTDPASLRITYDAGAGHAVVLILGEERFRQRLDLFLKHYPGIRDKLAPRAVLDVSLEGRVIARQ
jgi:cell division protein FtsQ